MSDEVPTAEKKGLFRGRWRILSLEIGAIFLGITTSFMVDEWREQRQDTETFHRILGEIYYDVRVDESVLVGSAAANNASLVHASDLVLRDSDLPPPDVLFERLETVFEENVLIKPTLAGLERLDNTPLAIPVNDVQLSLDNGYGFYIGTVEHIALQMAELHQLQRELWSSAGTVPCRNPIAVSVTDDVVEALDLLAQIQPSIDAIHEGDRCLPSPDNQRVAVAAMRDESFRTGLRHVIRIRQDLAAGIVGARTRLHYIRSTLEAYLPDIRLPVRTLGLVGDATGSEWDVARSIDMDRVGVHDWKVETRLSAGEVKFAANREWTMNWGAPRPWVAGGTYMSFGAGQVDVSEVFPAGTAAFNGINIPVEAGRYRVRFNTRSGAYSFERLPD